MRKFALYVTAATIAASGVMPVMTSQAAVKAYVINGNSINGWKGGQLSGNSCDLPGVQLPGAQLPGVQLPGVQLPEIQQPEQNRPETGLPDIIFPNQQKPETGLPDSMLPDQNQPETQPETQPENPSPQLPPQENTNNSYVQQVVDLVNEERAKTGAAPLRVSEKAAKAAEVRAREIARSFSHTRPDGSSYSTALTQSGASFRGSGENIAYGQRTPQAVMDSWMNSQGHRANILNSQYTDIGVGYFEDGNGTGYWVQLFIH